MEVWGTKVVALFVMGILTLFVGLFPIWLLKHFRSSLTNKNSRKLLDRVLSLLNCFVGGVFLATTLLHMLPEAREATEAYMSEYGIEIEFAVAEFTVAVGFFVVMVIEHIVMVCRQTPTKKKSPKKKKSDKAGILEQSQPIAVIDQIAKAENVANNAPCETDLYSMAGAHENVNEVRSRSISRSASLAFEGSFTISQTSGSVNLGHSLPHDHDHDHHHHHMDPSDLASVRSFVLLLAISIHTLFEGLAIGLQPTALGVWSLFLAIIIHKLIIAFSLGLQFGEHLQNKSKAVLFIVIFSVLSPIGIAVATALTAAGDSDDSLTFDAVNGILQCISTGTLLYVSFFEVLMGEVGNDHNLLKVLFVIFGFALMTLLQLFNHE